MHVTFTPAPQRASKMEQRINTLVREANAELESERNSLLETRLCCGADHHHKAALKSKITGGSALRLRHLFHSLTCP